jgi:hypothetical protein
VSIAKLRRVDIVQALGCSSAHGYKHRAQRLGKHRSKKATIEEALQEHVSRRKQLEVIQMFGQIDYDGSYNYSEARKHS